MPKVLVAGASGLVGEAAIRHFAALPGWEVVGLSRRTPAGIPRAKFISIDLLDAAACERAASEIGDVTHFVYAALQEAPGLFAGWTDPEMIERNAAMLRNIFEPLSAALTALEHVTLLHGTKAYGVHHPALRAEAARVPLRELEPRREHPNFYFRQEDYLKEKQRSASWGMTVFRPTVIYGGAWGNNMNPLPVLAAYALLLREAGEPLHFPGRVPGTAVREAVDAELVASAIAWAAGSAAARNETFNLTNGDVFNWASMWPGIAESIGMEPGEHRPLSLADDLPRQAERWRGIVAKYGLAAPADLLAFVGPNSLIYTDMLLGPARTDPPILNSTVKGRLAGFTDCIDTEDMFRKWFRKLADDGVLPPPR